jgi:hypothetical protein
MDESPSLNNLAHLLKLQKGQPDIAHNLLLASTISLTSSVVKQIYPSGNWANFSSYLHKREAKYGDLISLLSRHLHQILDFRKPHRTTPLARKQTPL